VSYITDILTEEEIKKSLQLQATNFASCFLKNDGNGHFTVTALPFAAQLSAVFGMLATDADGDGNLDVIINGNDYGTEIFTGRYDAFNGLLLKGDGKGNFIAQQPGQSGYYVPGDGKSLVNIKSATGQSLLLAAQNQGPLLAFENTDERKLIGLQPNDVSLIYFYKNGTSRKEEIFYGNSFYAQSGRYIVATPNVKAVAITDGKGNKREINF
jgi:hypothetical protein